MRTENAAADRGVWWQFETDRKRALIDQSYAQFLEENPDKQDEADKRRQLQYDKVAEAEEVEEDIALDLG